MPEKKSAAAEAPKSLLALVQGEPAAPVPPPGFYLDFTGHEDLLERVLAASEDVNGDVLVMLQALLDGKLYSRDDVFGVMCDVQ